MMNFANNNTINNNTNNEGETNMEKSTISEVTETLKKLHNELMEYTCCFCGRHTYNTQGACDDCIENGEVWFCDYCREYHPITSQSIKVHNEGLWCADAVENSAIMCDHCGNYYNEEDIDSAVDAETSADFNLCPDCYERHTYTCDNCNVTYYIYNYNNTYYVEGGSTICANCMESDDYYWCSHCDNLFHADDVTYYEGDYLCNDCYSDVCSAEDDGWSTIHSYSYKPSPMFHSTSKDKESTKLFLGFELEMSTKSMSTQDSVSEYISDEFSGGDEYFYLKSDSSIPDYGFELVTHPMTLNFHKEFNWDALLLYCREHDMTSHDAPHKNCGLHVHVSRNFLTDNQWIKVDWFVNKNRSMIEKLARRKDNEWARFVCTDAEPKLLFKDVYGKKKGSRYQAVNFENRYTVEFRIFRGSLKYETLMGTLELVHAICMWAKNTSATDIIRNINDSWGAFCTYAKENKYEALVTYMNVRGVL